MIRSDKLQPGEEVFAWKEPGGQMTYLATTRILNFCERTNHVTTVIVLKREFAAEFYRRKLTNAERILKLQDSEVKRPLLLVRHNYGTDFVAGHDRYCLAILRGQTSLPGYIVDRILWKQYLVKMEETHAG